MKSPYAGQPAKAFWRAGVADRHPCELAEIYVKKFPLLPQDKIATAGSCFAQHIARRLRQNNYAVIDAEPAPIGLSGADAQAFGYELYSARYGNIYTVRQLLQLSREAFGKFVPANSVWEKDSRYFDALRPSVEPSGLAKPSMVQSHRESHLSAVRKVLKSATVLVFTLGLTEAWIDRQSGTVYPTAPGTIAGSYDRDVYAFKNFTYTEIVADFELFRRLVRNVNPNVRFLLTVSPVPLTATATGRHVLPATIYSKSVLRAVAGYLYETYPDIDYFPSYEIIAGPQARGFFYESNLRNVTETGVNAVMQYFFREHPPITSRQSAPLAQSDESVVCEEVLLESFA